MAYEGPESIIDGLVKRLRDDLDAAIAAVDTADAADDGYTILRPGEALADERIHDFVPPIEFLYEFPTIGIGEGAGMLQDDTGFEATGVYQLVVVAYLADDDQAGLARRLRRLRKALARVVLNGRRVPAAAGGPDAAWGVRLLRFEPGPTLGELDADRVKTWMSSTALVIEAKRDETF